MSFSLISDYSFLKLTDVSPEFMKEKGLKLLLLDLDNTISPYGEAEPSPEIMRWVGKMRESGITLFIVSNTKKPRAGIFAEKMGIPYIMYAKKPSRRGLREAMRIIGCSEQETALAGDQTFTDVLAANRANVTSIMVEPIKLSNAFLTLRYWIEKPFRLLAKSDFRRKCNEQN